jgi:hypothetical protein
MHSVSNSPATPENNDYVPDFELHRDVVSEGNWLEYEAKGFSEFMPYTNEDDLSFARNVCGIEHVYTGDAYDDDAGRPLRHKPGRSIYVDPQGRLNCVRTMRRWRDRDFDRRRQSFRTSHDEGGPSSN